MGSRGLEDGRETGCREVCAFACAGTLGPRHLACRSARTEAGKTAAAAAIEAPKVHLRRRAHPRAHPRTHARTNARTRPRTHAPTHARTHPHPPTHPRTHAHTHAPMHTHMQVYLRQAPATINYTAVLSYIALLCISHCKFVDPSSLVLSRSLSCWGI